MTSPLDAQPPADPAPARGWQLDAPAPVRPRVAWALPPITLTAHAPENDAAQVRRHSASFDIGDATASIEGLRGRVMEGDKTRAKLWATGLHLDWPITGRDGLTFGLTQSFAKSAQPKWLIARPHFSTASSMVEMAWLHDDRWRLSLGWHRDAGGRAANGAERLAEIADGAAIHESGVRATLALMPTGTPMSLGIEGRSETLARDDLLLVGAGHRQDNRLSLFLRTRF